MRLVFEPEPTQLDQLELPSGFIGTAMEVNINACIVTLQIMISMMLYSFFAYMRMSGSKISARPEWGRRLKR